MKYICYVLFLLFFLPFLSVGQGNNLGSCGGPVKYSQKNPTVQNGSTTLGQIYNKTACGLNYTQASRKIGQRFHNTTSSCNPTDGALQPATLAISGIPTCSTIDKAYLWCSTSGNGIAINATLKNPLGTTANFPMTIVGTDVDKCWSATGTYTYRADVTSAISGNGNYTISNLPTYAFNPVIGNDVDGVTLFIIYKDHSVSYSGTIVIDDGAIERGNGLASHSVSSFNACSNASYADAFMIVSDMQCTPFGNNKLTLNGVCCTTVNEDWWNFISLKTVTINAGQTSSSFAVDNSASFDCFDFLMAGVYFRTTTCTVCTPSALSIASDSTPASCGNMDGTATVIPSGGSGSYTYSWNTIPVQTTQTATGLDAGTYIATVTDSNGCVGTKSVTVTSSSLPSISVSPDTAICFGNFVVLHASGGTAYQWSPAAGLDDPTSSDPNCFASSTTTYTVVVSAGPCSDSGTVTVTIFPDVPPPTIHQATDTLYCTIDPSYSTFQWYFNDTLIINATGTYYIATESGNYNVAVTDTNGCSISVGINIILNVGLQAIADPNGFALSPNPARNELLINGKGLSEKSSVVIFNAIGEKIMEEKVKQNDQALINISNLSGGFYFIKVQQPNSSWIGRFVKD